MEQIHPRSFKVPSAILSFFLIKLCKHFEAHLLKLSSLLPLSYRSYYNLGMSCSVKWTNDVNTQEFFNMMWMILKQVFAPGYFNGAGIPIPHTN